MITALTVSYNTPEYLERLLSSFRKFYDIPYLVIDGSDEENYNKIKDFDKRFNVELLHFNYNIHHGPGMTYGLNYIKTDQVLLVDSDIIVHGGGWLEMMERELRPDAYGIGDIQQEYFLKNVIKKTHIRGHVSKLPRTKRVVSEKVWIPYLHPVLALVNREVVLRFRPPFKGGAPLIHAMEDIWRAGKSDELLQCATYIKKDLWEHTCKYVQHNHNHEGMGTVVSTNGYHLDR